MASNGLKQLFRLPGIPYALGARKVDKDHLRRLIVQEHEAERALYKAMVTDTTLPLAMRLQVSRDREGASLRSRRRPRRCTCCRSGLTAWWGQHRQSRGAGAAAL